MNIEKHALKRTIETILHEGLSGGQDLSIVTDSVMECIESLIVVAEASGRSDLEAKVNIYWYKYQMNRFIDDLKERFKHFKPDPETDYQGSFSLEGGWKSLQIIMNEWGMDREEALENYFLWPETYSRKIFHVLGRKQFLLREKHSYEK